MLFLLFIVGLGIYKKQPRKYWLYSIPAFLLNQMALFAGNSPERQQQALYGSVDSYFWISTVFLMVLAWVVPIALVKAGYRKTEKSLESGVSEIQIG